jgi:very-short-patch-repair endonuclease
MARIHNLNFLKEYRTKLRKDPTDHEEILWWHLKAKRMGVKFRRQHSVGGYILDFYCKEKRLVIELDGSVHNTPEAKEYDRVRDDFFKGLDYTVLRFYNSEIEKDISKVLSKIRQHF